MSLSRRDWLRSVPAVAVGASLGTSTASAIEPIKRVGKSHIKLSLAGYSFRQWLDLKKPKMKYSEFLDLAATYPLDAVELTEYYFENTSAEYIGGLKGHCTRLGLDVSGTAIRSDFCQTDPAKYKAEIDHVKKSVAVASLLGAKTIRIFGGTLKKGQDEQAAIKQCVEGVQECCEYAGRYGIYLALENHGGITSTAEQMLNLVKSIKSDWFGLNFDSGNFHTEDPYGDLAKVAPYAIVAQIKTEMHPKGKEKEETDLGRVVEILKKANFRGHIALEYEAAEDAMVAVPRHLATLRKLIS